MVWEYAADETNEPNNAALEEDAQGDFANSLILNVNEAMTEKEEHPTADPVFTSYVDIIRAHQTTSAWLQTLWPQLGSNNIFSSTDHASSNV